MFSHVNIPNITEFYGVIWPNSMPNTCLSLNFYKLCANLAKTSDNRA